MSKFLLPPVESLLKDDAWRDPAPLLARLREHDPVHWVEGLDFWLVTRHHEVLELFKDPRVSADPREWERYEAPTEGKAARWLGEMPFRSKPSDPRMLGRRLVSAALTPRATARMDQRIAEVVERFAAPMRGRSGVVDVLAEYTFPVSRTVIGHILGVPPKGDDAERFRVLASSTSRGINPIISEKKRLESERSSIELCEYLLTLVAQRREEPRDDLISELLRASEEDAHATVEDIVRTIGGLVSAGTITTGHASTRALRTLLHNPDQLELLRSRPSLMPGAVNELLRHHSGLFGFPRYVLEDFELLGRGLRKGQLVILSILAANRDPAVFPDPDRLDITRDTRESLSFGHGAHYCIGSNLAFVQMCRTLSAAIDFLPRDARLLEDRIRWSARGIQARIKSLPVDFGGG